MSRRPTRRRARPARALARIARAPALVVDRPLVPWAGRPEFVVNSRICLVHPSGKPRAPVPVVDAPVDAARYLRHLAQYDQETSVLLILNAKNHLLAAFPVSIGGARHAGSAEEGQYLKVPLLVGGVRVITAHNHPSGSAQASPADHRKARKRRDLYRKLGIQLVDSLVIAQEGFYSVLRDETGYWGRPVPRRLARPYLNPRGGRFMKWPPIPARVLAEEAPAGRKRRVRRPAPVVIEGKVV
jgi:hypothetical protein